jgi:conjugative relaxase-like TrwC/TraI family protein
MMSMNWRYGATAVKEYFTQHLTRDDYFTRGEQEIIGDVKGRGAELLGMDDQITKEQYFRLIDGKHPMTGEKLGGRNKENARVAMEVTVDIPKYGTLAARLGGHEYLLDDFKAAVDETFDAMEDDMRCRVRKDGQDGERVTANAVRVGFWHTNTRNLKDGTCDLHDHGHHLFPNKTFDAVEDEWKACEWGRIKEDGLYWQSVLHAKIAKRWADRGFGIERDGKSFKLVGIDREIVDIASRRTAVIEAEAKRLGITNGKIKSRLGQKTRGKKDPAKGVDVLIAETKARLTPDQLSQLTNANQIGNRYVSPQESVDYAIAHCFHKDAVVPEKRLWAEALMHGVGSVTPEEIKSEFAKRQNLIYQGEKGERKVTTREWERDERKPVAFVREGRGTCRKLWKKGVTLSDKLDPEQRKAAEHILNSRDRVILLSGAAGSGKTYTMRAVRDVIEQSGKKVGAFAQSTQASRKNLREETFADADTLAKLRTDEKLQQKYANQVIFIDEIGMVGVKEMNELFDLAQTHNWRILAAGDSSQHAPVEGPSALRLIERYSGAKPAVLRANRRQIDPDYKAIVNDIRSDESRSAHALTEDGKTTYLERALKKLDEKGWLVELPKNALYARAAQDYLEGITDKPGKQGSTGLMLTVTHKEADALTDDIRAGLREMKWLKREDHAIATLVKQDWSPPQRGVAINYEPGLVVQFERDAKGIKRGERFTVTGRKGELVTMRRGNGEAVTLPLHHAERFQVYRTKERNFAVGDLVRPTKNGMTKPIRRNGETVQSKVSNGDSYRIARITPTDIVMENGYVLPRDFGHLRPGYTLTSFASQSRTVDRMYGCITENSMNAANLEQLYVSLSRGRKTAFVYTDNKEALFAAVKKSSLRQSAHELQKTPATQAAEDRTRFLGRLKQFHHHRVREGVQSIWERGRELYRQVTRREHAR